MRTWLLLKQKERVNKMGRLSKITPIHIAIQGIDDLIKTLQLQKAELAATLPRAKKKQSEKMYFRHPLTGDKLLVKDRRSP